MFFRTVNFLGKCIANVAQKSSTTYAIEDRHIVGVGEKHPQDVAFKKLKVLISSIPVLSHFNPDLPVTLATDALQYSLG